jgi:hypothetical protein
LFEWRVCSAHALQTRSELWRVGGGPDFSGRPRAKPRAEHP